MKKLILVVISILNFCITNPASAQDADLKVFTWDGYVAPEDITAVNKLLETSGNPIRVKVIQPFAEGPEQMFNVIREGKCDLSFLTLNYIYMQNGKIAKLLQPIDTNKLKSYNNVLPALKTIPMGMTDGKPLYVPYGGGAYGIWANMKKIKKEELPSSIKNLLEPKWKGKLSLTKGQIQPNVSLAMMAMGKTPFYLNDLIVTGKRDEATKVLAKDGDYQNFLNQLYSQVGSFWGTAPEFPENLWLVASYGPEIASLRAKGEDWQLVNFKEGNTVWLDTMNIMAHVKDKKLEAAYTFINYFLDKEVQNRVVNGLSMVAVTSTVKNPLIEANPKFFEQGFFWPPYDTVADNMMKKMSDDAMATTAVK